MSTGYTQALIYNKCPDSARVYSISGDEISTIEEDLCDNEEVEIYTSQYVIANWTRESYPPFQNEEDPVIEGVQRIDRRVNITSASLITGMVASSSDIQVDFYVLNCSSDIPVLISTKSISTSYSVYTIPIPLSCISECSLDGIYSIGIEPQAQGWGKKYVEMDLLNLSIEYDLEIIYGKLSASISAPQEISKYDDNGYLNYFSITAETTCSNGDCGEVEMLLEWSEDGVTYKPVPVGFGDIFYVTSNNLYSCQNLNSQNTQCSYIWTVQISDDAQIKPYYFRVKANSSYENVGEVYSGEVQTVLKLGNITIESAYLSNTTIYTGEFTTLSASVSCTDYYCGDVKIYAKNDGVLLTDQGDLTTQDENPVICRLGPGNTCLVSWSIQGNTEGTYSSLGVYAQEVENVGETDEQTLTLQVISPLSPSLSLNASLTPIEIEKGETANLTATISCLNGPCGNVSVYAMQDTTEIPVTSGDITVDENPKTWKTLTCLENMQDGDLCRVTFIIKGNSPGTYQDIYVKAVSTNTQDALSSKFYLTVAEPLGNIIFSDVSITPNLIETGNTSQISGNLYCTENYCGNITVSLRYENGELIGKTGDLTTDDANPFVCGVVSNCKFSWNVKGNTNGTYLLSILSESNESISNETHKTLTVKAPGSQISPVLSISPMENLSFTSGQSISLQSSVFCSGEDCGEVEIYLQIKLNGEWTNLTENTVVNTPENKKSYILNAGDEEIVSWEIGCSEVGVYELRIVADGISLDVQDAYEYFQVEVTSQGEISISIISPKDGSTFSRGENMDLEAEVRVGNEPKSGLAVKVYSKDLFRDTVLKDLGNGRYKASIKIPQSAQGKYTVTFSVEGKEKSTTIKVNPEIIKVRIRTDGYNYTTADAIILYGTVKKNNLPVKATVKLTFCKQKTEVIKTNETGEYYLKYELFGLPEGICTIEVYASDEYENFGTAKTNINIVKSENEIYTIVFFEPKENQRIKEGSDVNISLKVFWNSLPVSGADVTCRDPFGNKITLDEEDATYSTTIFRIGRNPNKEEWIVDCTA
ncbi:hypothetical protein DRJ04_08415, partial [Candidatus Aerophobetes bacterium]